MSNYITKDELAKIAISKNLIKEYKSSNSERTVYLNDGTEFQIYLKNPYQTHLGIKISVNNKSIGNMLVLRPGQSFWLDRFLNDNKKFLFSTYNVENTAEMKYATNNNGKVKIEFYHEKEETPYTCVIGPLKTNFGCPDIVTTATYNSDTINTCRSSKSFNNPINTCCYSTVTIESSANAATNSKLRSMSYGTSISAKNTNDSYLETGRVEKGGVSRQEFECCDIQFDYYAFKTENILILPTSRKQIRAEETRRRYCSQCGKKVNPKDKFCSNCGAKLT